jgi:Ca2+:H+ antiporter
MAFVAGGFNRVEQNFNTTVAQTASSLLALAVGSLIVPTAFHLASSAGDVGITELSRGTAIILLLVYGAYLFFQLRSHTNLYNEPSAKAPKRNKAVAPVKSLVESSANTSHGVVMGKPKPSVEDKPETAELSLWAAAILLVSSTVLVAICAECLVDSIDHVVTSAGISRVFVGLILLPIVGNAAEHATAVTVAVKDKMDLSIGVAVGSSMQIALLVIPFIVVLGWIMGIDEMTLYFDGFQVMILFIAILLVNYLIQVCSNTPLSM